MHAHALVSAARLTKSVIRCVAGVFVTARTALMSAAAADFVSAIHKIMCSAVAQIFSAGVTRGMLTACAYFVTAWHKLMLSAAQIPATYLTQVMIITVTYSFTATVAYSMLTSVTVEFATGSAALVISFFTRVVSALEQIVISERQGLMTNRAVRNLGYENMLLAICCYNPAQICINKEKITRDRVILSVLKVITRVNYFDVSEHTVKYEIIVTVIGCESSCEFDVVAHFVFGTAADKVLCANLVFDGLDNGVSGADTLRFDRYKLICYVTCSPFVTKNYDLISNVIRMHGLCRNVQVVSVVVRKHEFVVTVGTYDTFCAEDLIVFARIYLGKGGSLCARYTAMLTCAEIIAA